MTPTVAGTNSSPRMLSRLSAAPCSQCSRTAPTPSASHSSSMPATGPGSGRCRARVSASPSAAKLHRRASPSTKRTGAGRAAVTLPPGRSAGERGADTQFASAAPLSRSNMPRTTCLACRATNGMKVR